MGMFGIVRKLASVHTEDEVYRYLVGILRFECGDSIENGGEIFLSGERIIWCIARNGAELEIANTIIKEVLKH